ncbi:MAG: hypothetical protein ACR2N5_06615 [Solirubrobacterales bacterium]
MTMPAGIAARGAVGALAGAVLIGSMFLDWYSNGKALELLEMLREQADAGAELPVSESDINISAIEFSDFGPVAALLLLLSGAASIASGLSLAFRKGLDAKPAVRRDLASVLLVAGALGIGVIVYRMIVDPVDPLVGSLSLEPGLFVGLGAAIAIAIAGLLAVFAARKAASSSNGPAAAD